MKINHIAFVTLGFSIVLLSCGLPTIHSDAEKYSLSGVACPGSSDSNCFPLPPDCNAAPYPAKDLQSTICAEWARYSNQNQEAITHRRNFSSWIGKSGWWGLLPWAKQKQLTRDWSPADDSSSFESYAGTSNLCLAMSGGGLRSAAVNIGVLGGFHDLSVLDKVEIMSAVSGGSSALAWYFSQHEHQIDVSRAISDNALFDDNGIYQKHLSNHYVTFRFIEYVAGASLNGLFVPVNLIANGLFGWHANTSPLRHWYESRLRDTFQIDPSPQSTAPEASPLRMKDLRKVIGKKGLPWPIVNATALIESDRHHYGSRLGNVVFQFTPKSFGSDAFGYHSYATDAGRELTLSRIVSISSAAFDGANLVSGPSQSVFWSALNQDSGMYIHNPNLERREREWNRLKIFPWYLFNHYRRDIQGTDIYLSDGGHSENLGAYALVRRGCKKIIIVDAEHDPTFIFESYSDLKRGLKAEIGTLLSVDAIDKTTKVNAKLDDNTQKVMDRPAWKDVARKPIFEGSIRGLPINSNKEIRIPILYIKMAYWRDSENNVNLPWEERLMKMSCVAGEAQCELFKQRQQRVHRAFEKDRSNDCPYDSKTLMYNGVSVVAGICPFPHRATKNQSFTASEYEAWRDLGRLLVQAYGQCVRNFAAIGKCDTEHE